MSEKSFNERVREEMINAAIQYKQVYVDYEYLICSEAFVEQDFYIVAGREDNFQHLTGVNSTLSPKEFYFKCLQGVLEESDFDFAKSGQDEKMVKGTVRRKIQILPSMMELFKAGVKTEEKFKKNKVSCSFATADGMCTLGFSESQKARPKTLLKGNELNNPKPVELILRKKAGTKLFDEIVLGNVEIIQKYREKIQKLLSEELLNA